MRLYIENPKHTTRKLLELITDFGKVANFTTYQYTNKINAQKSLTLLHTNNKK